LQLEPTGGDKLGMALYDMTS